MNKKTGKYLLVNLFLAAFTVLTIIPVIYILKIAFAGGQSFSESPGLIPEGFDLKNFYDLFTTITDSEGNPLFLRQIFNSVIVSAATTLAGILIACSAAYCFSRFTFPGRKAGMIMFLVSQMFPGVMMMIPLYILMEKLHLLNTLAGLTLVYSTTTIPFSVWMLKGYFDTIPKELEEAALIDGAGTVRIFYKIILPLSMPAVAVTALFSFMSAWNEFVLAYTFLNEETAFTMPVTIRNFVGEKNIQWGYFAASSIIASAPVIALFYALQKYLVAGLTAGSVKM